MFTGIIHSIGTVKSLVRKNNSAVLRIQAPLLFDQCRRGDSISVNGVCLTIHELTGQELTMNLLLESIDRSMLGSLKVGNRLNLEPAVTPHTPLGGHMVQGHVDGVAKVKSVLKMPEQWELKVTGSPDWVSTVFPKASIAINGISLTVVEVDKLDVTVAIIPTTYQDTTIQFLKRGDLVNVETDIIGKYVYHYLTRGNEDKISKLTKEFLNEHGF